MSRRSDQALAIYGVLALGALGLIAYTVLVALGKEVPEVLLAVIVASTISGTLGWSRGGTYYDDTPEVVPTPPPLPDAYSAELTRTGQ